MKDSVGLRQETKLKETALTVEAVECILRYDEESGELFWKVPVGGQGARISAGSLAGHVNKVYGYCEIRIKGVLYKAHRLIWLLSTGTFPSAFIDHINGDRSDNRLTNLREATPQENSRNMGKRKDNTSGCAGVTWYKRHQKWRVYIMVDGKNKHLGYYNELDEALTARKDAEVKYFGRFQRKVG